MLYSCFTLVVRRCYYFSLYLSLSLSIETYALLLLYLYTYIYTPALLLFLFLCVYIRLYLFYSCFTPALLYVCVCVCIRIWRVVEKKLFILRHLGLVFTGVARLKFVANALLLLYIARLYEGTWRWCLHGLLD